MCACGGASISVGVSKSDIGCSAYIGVLLGERSMRSRVGSGVASYVFVEISERSIRSISVAVVSTCVSACVPVRVSVCVTCWDLNLLPTLSLGLAPPFVFMVLVCIGSSNPGVLLMFWNVFVLNVILRPLMTVGCWVLLSL